ncbi:MAG: HD domain-containing protein [Sulfurimonas sp.]|nr:HD domain-containing protein [Sulfurimonas sp.]
MTLKTEINNSFFSKPFLESLFFVQNKWHQHGIFVHTLRVVYCTLKAKEFKMLGAALFHDVGKPSTAFVKDDEDRQYNEYSFTDHEERSYQIIKNWSFLSEYTKNMVRYHYLIRDISLSKSRNKQRYEEKKNIWDGLSQNLQDDLAIFLKLDDEGKGKKRR